MSNKTYKIYLAGTIYTNPPHRFWKSDLKDKLRIFDNQFFFYDPEPSMECCNNMNFVVRDKAWISDSDFLIAYIDTISAGTSMEILYAHQFGTKYVLIIDPNQCLESNLWLKYHSHKIYGSIDKCVKDVLLLVS